MSELQNLTKELLKDKEFKKLKAERERIFPLKEQGKEYDLSLKSTEA